MKSKNTVLTALAVLLACALVGAAAKAGKNPCKADVEKFCKGVQPGGGNLIKCLKEHEAELSPGCKAKEAEGKEKIERFKKACGADMDKFCKDVKPGGGLLGKCLKDHEAELSAACSGKIAEQEEGFIKDHPCAADMETLCKDIKQGGGAKIRCIKEHEAELSDACMAKIAAIKEEFNKKNPCGPDIEKFCGDVQPGEGRLITCLKAHEAKLSAECKDKGIEVKEKAVKFLEACQTDLDRFCKNVKQGEGRLIKCLKEHEKDVSGKCRTKITETQ